MKTTATLFFILIFMTSCNILLDTDSKIPTISEDCENVEGEPQKILLIGNSYLSQNNIPKLLKDISCSKGLKTKIYEISEHNFRFLNHDEFENTTYLIKHEKWDFVILQNHGQVGSWEEDQLRDESLPHAVSLANKIKENHLDTKIIFMQTWGRKDGDQTNCDVHALVCDFSGHTQALEDGYEIYATETDSEVALVGNAFELIVNNESSPIPFGDLWMEDGAHASYVGSYLAAAVLYSKITSFSPVGAMSANGLTRVQSLYLQSIAAQIAGP